MNAVLQRVKQASVAVNGTRVSGIGRGILAFIGIAVTDELKDVEIMALKIPEIRLFADQSGKMNCSLRESGGELLLVPNFTLQANLRHGRRPDFTGAAPQERASDLFNQLVSRVQNLGVRLGTGVFGETMVIEAVNDGPATFIFDTREAMIPRRLGSRSHAQRN
jgi:D-tyrosyl-tRNA(Tyr) deacylase